MSVLTKLFVVLLVVSSLLLSASVVVFVNRVENSNEAATRAKTELKNQQNQNSVLAQNLSDAKSQLLSQAKDSDARIGELTRKLADGETAIQGLNGQLAQAQKDAQVAAAQSKGLADALKASQTENQGLQTAYTEQRNKNDELLKQNGELNTTVTTLDNKIRQEQKHAEYSDERVAELTNQLKQKQQGGKGAADAGATEGAAAPATGPINGVVRSVDVIGGKKYATISVGSADNVTKGTKFNVIDRNASKFLGFLTVDSVEPHEAIGQLEGSVDKVQAGAEVKTQLGQ